MKTVSTHAERDYFARFVRELRLRSDPMILSFMIKPLLPLPQSCPLVSPASNCAIAPCL